MKYIKVIRKIRNYCVISFFLPIIAINSCLFIYKLLGDIDTYPNYNWNEKEIKNLPNNYLLWDNLKLADISDKESSTLNCPKYSYKFNFTTIDNETLKRNVFIFTLLKDQKEISKEDLILIGSGTIGSSLQRLHKENKIKSIEVESKKFINKRCIKNYKFSYWILNHFHIFEKILLNAKKDNIAGFAKVKNPYLYGEVSISRTARYFPATVIFKPLIILCAIFLFLYWKNNFNLFRELENNNILSKFSKKFYYLGVISCIFLILHALFLGLDFDSKVFTKIRRVVIILFIFFEIFAQFFLTKNLYKFRNELKNYLHPLIIKMKVIFVAIIFFATLVIFTLLIWFDLSASIKHILEWNYFSILLIFYVLSRLLWKRTPITS